MVRVAFGACVVKVSLAGLARLIVRLVGVAHEAGKFMATGHGGLDFNTHDEVGVYLLSEG
jgi:hypothetical protein